MKRFLSIGIVVAVTLVAGFAIAMGASSGMGATRAGGVSVKQEGSEGRILVSGKGLALYINNQDRPGRPLCTGACLSFWKPVTASKAPRISSLSGKFALIKRGSAKQVTYKGKPLYTFVLDQPGQVHGDGFHDAFGGVQFIWHVVHAGKSSSSSTTTTGTGTNGSGGYIY